jgi:hypothetical protein
MPDKKQAVQEEVDSDCLFGNCLFRFLLSKVEYQASFHLARVHFNKGFAGDRTGDDRSVTAADNHVAEADPGGAVDWKLIVHGKR